MRRVLLLGLLALVISLVGIGVAPSASANACEYVQVNQYWVQQCTVSAREIRCYQVTYWDGQLGLNVVARACHPTQLW